MRAAHTGRLSARYQRRGRRWGGTRARRRPFYGLRAMIASFPQRMTMDASSVAWDEPLPPTLAARIREDIARLKALEIAD